MRIIFRTQDVNTTGFNTEKADRARKKGDLVEILDDGVYAGHNVEPTSPTWEGLHVVVNVPDITRSEAVQYKKRWHPKIAYDVIASNARGYRIRAYVTNPGLSGLGNLTKEKIEHLITEHGGRVISFATNEVTFDIPIDTADDLKEIAKDYIQSRTLKRSQFHITAAEINNILSNGGEVTISRTTLLNKLKDKLND